MTYLPLLNNIRGLHLAQRVENHHPGCNASGTARWLSCRPSNRCNSWSRRSGQTSCQLWLVSINAYKRCQALATGVCKGHCPIAQLYLYTHPSCNCLIASTCLFCMKRVPRPSTDYTKRTSRRLMTTQYSAGHGISGQMCRRTGQACWPRHRRRLPTPETSSPSMRGKIQYHTT